MQRQSILAAVDLGSNSFRLQIARVEDDQLYMLDSLREPVRLAAGLKEDKRLNKESQQRALACLERFGERLRSVPRRAVRAVGTNALRVAKNAGEFLQQAEAALGFPIEVIAGREEARLIYLGVAQGLPQSDLKRLVMDIGGGSTEFIIGAGLEPLRLESLYMGCVSYSQRYFADGKIAKSNLKEAELAARNELQTIVSGFSAGHWDIALGSSGTARILCDILEQNGMSDAGITRDGLEHYMIQLFFYGHMEMNLHGRTIRNRPGQIVGFDLGEIMDSVNSDFDMLCVIVPRARLAPLLAQPDSLHGLIPAVDEGSGLLLANYMRTLYRAAPMLSPAEASASAHALLDLIASAFNNAAMGRDNGYERRHQLLLLRAQQFIRDNLGSPGLSPENIATNIGVSRSSLYQVFEPVGGIAEYIRELRLRKCLTEIVGAHSASTRIGEIGFRWGFGNPSAFTRSFKQRFGRTPSEARELGYTQTRRAATSIDPRAGNRLHEEWIAGLT